MKFLMLYKPANVEKVEQGIPPSPQEIERMGKYVEEQIKSGALLANEGCAPTALGAKVRLANGNVTVVDGPFSEAKEVIAGMALVQAKSKQEAILMAKDFLKIAGDGETEIRQVFERGDGPCNAPKLEA